MIQVEGIFAGGGESKYKPYLTFISPYAFTVSVSTPGWDGTMEYSTNATTWTAWDGSAITSAIGVNDDAGYYVVYLRGSGNTVFVGGTVEGATGFTLDGMSIQCKGNIEMLLDYATAEAGGHPFQLFGGAVGLSEREDCLVMEVCTFGIYARHLAACSKARVYAHDGLLSQGCREEELSQVGAEHVYGFVLGSLAALLHKLVLYGRAYEALIGVLRSFAR